MEFIENKKNYRVLVITLLSLLVVLNLSNNCVSVNVKDMTSQQLKEVEKDKVIPEIIIEEIKG